MALFLRSGGLGGGVRPRRLVLMDPTEIELALSMVKRIQRESRAVVQLLARLRDAGGESESILEETNQLRLQPQEVQANGSSEGNDRSSVEDR